MRKKWTIALVILLVVLVMPSWVLSESERPRGRLVFAYPSLGTEVHDGVKTLGQAEEAIIQSLGDGLCLKYFEGASPSYQPAIATSWKVSPDLKAWEFTIKKDVIFHDGAPLTVEDIVYTWDRILHDPLTALRGPKRIIKTVEAIGDDRVVFNLKRPYPFLLTYASRYAIQPKAYSERVGVEEFEKQPIYAGPWKLVKHLQGDYVELEAFKGHYRQVPHAKTLILKVVPEQSTQLAMLKTGQVDIVAQISGGPIIEGIRKDPNLELITFPAPAEIYVYFSYLTRMDNPPTVFRDKRVRHALSYALDRKLLNEKIFAGTAQPASTICILPGTPKWHPSSTPFPLDIEKAKALLTEAGYPDGFEAKLILTPREKTLGEACALMWSKIGVKCNIEMRDTTTVTRQIRKRQLPDCMRISRHPTGPAAMSYFFPKRVLFNHMVDDILDELTAKMSAFPEGPEMDEFVKNEMCRYIHDLMPGIPILATSYIYGVRAGIGGRYKWLEIGTRHANYGPAAEYLIPPPHRQISTFNRNNSATETPRP
jgi:peptide/nickel transport system substrate-binding protein